MGVSGEGGGIGGMSMKVGPKTPWVLGSLSEAVNIVISERVKLQSFYFYQAL